MVVETVDQVSILVIGLPLLLLVTLVTTLAVAVVVREVLVRRVSVVSAVEATVVTMLLTGLTQQQTLVAVAVEPEVQLVAMAALAVRVS